jgi:methionyl-tRNA synthetase
MAQRTLITAALPYVNSYIHLGHLAGAYLPADMYARFLRLSGREVLFVCGSDEHGVAITISAEKEGSTPRQVIDKYHPLNQAAFQNFAMSFDIYSRTSMPEHFETAQEFFKDWLDKGLLVEKEEPQFYDEKAAMFLPDRYVEGICPNCGKDGARGDQCDNCGATYNQTELKSPRSVITGQTPVVRSTKHWYFRMGEFQQKLEEYIESHASDWKDNVLQQSRSWLKQGLNDRAATRDMNWGIPVPVPGAEGKVIYVWFEAVLGYISATRHWAKQNNLPEDAWKQWWSAPQPDEDKQYIAFLGKDNIVFHALIFPMLLMAKGDYILPTNVPANEFLNFEGKKFSKSRHWGIFLQDFQKDFPGGSNTDMLRYALAMNLPETKDADFTWRDLQARTNNELAAIPGNFINRVTQFLHKNFEGKVPVLPERYAKLPDAWNLLLQDFRRESASIQREELSEKYEAGSLRYFSNHDFALIAALWTGMNKVAAHYRNFRFRDAITETMNVARAANKYFNDKEPWKTVKNDPDDCARTLYICAQTLHALTVLMAPVLPNTSASMCSILSLPVIIGNSAEILADTWSTIPMPVLEQGLPIQQPPILFSKLEDSVIQAHIAAMGNTEQENQENPIQDLITIDDFKKIKLRTARVIAAEKLPKSEKLLRLQVDTGTEKRQILAGIAKFYTPEQMIGKMVIIVANLQPAKLMGHESQGMLLAANMPDGSLCLVEPAGDAQPGAEVR